ncbi:DNA-directed RNA polymerase subunit epsilon [Companilactobacillus sp. DQM5]|uniref:DNA-directed RNA polymerase subunit epsilon n=1 Tax=Companilactobacillus sp. DQM5 TaxID=3463359 RepID=UPI004057FE62
MIYKVLFQPDKSQTPRRESTQSIYVEANSKIEALESVENNTNYNIELVQELSSDFLEYEKKNPDFKITEF